MVPEKTVEDVRRFATMVAAKQGWEVNRDADFTETLVQGLQVNWNRYGYFLCPCRDSDGSREADAKVICPCVYAKLDIEEHGHCYCALYLRPGFSKAGGIARGIPDRRIAST